MATEKRKAVTAERPTKKIRFDDNGKARKVPNTPDKTAIPRSKTKAVDDSLRKPVKSSLLLDEEKSFPRGGASVLTPLEQRQIRAEADRDVLFEEQGKSKVIREEYGEDEDSPRKQARTTSKTSGKKRGKTSQSKSAADKEDQEVDQVKIHGLGYKTLTAGSLVLGQVTSITSKDVVLALPNHLTGFIPITAISDTVNTKIEKFLAEDSSDSEEADESEDNDDVELKKLFRIGQYLRAYVISTTSDSGSSGPSKSRRHIELSINPRLANSGLASDNLSNNQMVQVSVDSVEDHGLVVDLGFEDRSVRGFISKKELGQQWNIEDVSPGQVMLCCITGSASDGKVVKLCPDPLRNGDITKRVLKDAKTIDPFVPGTLVEALITTISAGGIAGKIMGSVDVTADTMHSGISTSKEIFEKLKIGQKVTGRIICTFPESETKKVGFSLLDHVKKFEEQAKSGKKKTKQLTQSAIIESATVTQVLPGIGLFLDIGVSGQLGFAHISKLADERIEALFEETGTFAINTTHRARVLGYNPIDGTYSVSLQKSVLDRKFLRLEDVKIGSVVEGKVEKIILGAKGITGVLVTLDEGITGLVPEMHMSDVKLQHPEKRFRESLPVKARVLSVDTERRQMRLTLKKALLNTDAATWKDYSEINVGDESVGTVIKTQANGAVLQFYGNVRAWLPVSEMSEAYIADASQHFRVGQTVMVHAKKVNADEEELLVSCRDTTSFSEEQTGAWNELQVGQVVPVKVSEISNDNATFELEQSPIKGIARVGQFTDGGEDKSRKFMQKLRIGQKLSEALILNKDDKQHILALSCKQSLISAAKTSTLIIKFADAVVGAERPGFVRNITPDGVFVEFAAGVVGYLPKTQIAKEHLALPAFGYRKDVSISSRILHIDASRQRIALSTREGPVETPKKEAPSSDLVPVNPVDGVSFSLTDFSLGRSTQARVVSVKDTQLNVQLADNIQGRIDMSEIFNTWEEIKDRRRPLANFKPKQVLPVKVLGIHDARSHRFLPISHRQAKVPVFELTAKVDTKLDSEADHLTLANLQIGSEWIAFVNNISEGCVWANITPNIRGRIEFMDLTDDTAALQDISKAFPIGSAVRVKVKSKDLGNNRLDFISANASKKAALTLENITAGSVLAGKVVRVTERSVLVSLSESLMGVIGMTDMTDDYNQAITTSYTKNEILRVCVLDVDLPNKRLFLSTRPSRILSSSLPIKDPQITSIGQIKPLDILRGFVKLVRPNGLIVSLGPRVEAFVRVSDLSDAYIKDWQSEFSIDRLVRGKILAVDANLNHVQMSLKASHVDEHYTPPRKLEDLAEGEVVTGKVRKVEEFGVFIDVDNTMPKVSGLCHRSQIADAKSVDVKKLYDEGDAVKAKVLKIELEKRRISFGLKASYFADDAEHSEDDSMDDAEGLEHGAVLDQEPDVEMEDEGGVDLGAVIDADGENGSESDDMEMDEPVALLSGKTGLKTSGFDWTGAVNTSRSKVDYEDSDDEPLKVETSSKKKAQPTFIDRTGDLDVNGPQSAADFERLLLSAPHDSQLWVAYMAYHLRLSEVQAARDIGRRALQTIPLREVDEKLNVWIALLNLEVSYSTTNLVDDHQTAMAQDTSDPLEQVFRDACAVQDPYSMHLHLASIFTASSQQDKADQLYQSMLSSNPSLAPSPFRSPVATAKLTKSFRALPDLWLTYAAFLFEHMSDPVRARALLSRALQSVPDRSRRDTTVDFAKLEFRLGDAERGRTLLEGVLAEWPRLATAWDAWLDAEMGLLNGLTEAGDVKDQLERTRRLFERLVGGKMKARRARFVFKRWREFEEKFGDERSVERVMGLAKEWVESAKNKGKEAEE